MKKLFLFLLAAFVFAACNKDDNGSVGDLFHRPGKGMFVVNEGQMGKENASLSYYDPDTKQLDEEICYRANNLSLGDVAQSMTIIGSRGFIAVTNSGVVPVINTTNFKYVGGITGLNKPRYVLPVSAEKIYISSGGEQTITIADPNTLRKSGTIDLGAHSGRVNTSEQMVRFVDDDGVTYVFAASYNYNNRVFKIDTRDNTVAATIELDHWQPAGLAIDTNGQLWILSDGGASWGDGVPSYFTPTPRALTRIDAAEFDYGNADVFEFDAAVTENLSVSKLTINAAGDKLYFLCMDYSAYTGGVYEMDVTASALPATPVIEGEFYGLGVDPDNGDVYVSKYMMDEHYNMLPGKVFRYDSGYTLRDDFSTGLFLGSFCFKPE